MTKASGTAEEQRAIEFLRWTGWLADHDREIYEQGQREGKPIGVGKWIARARGTHSKAIDVACSVCGYIRFYDECNGVPIDEAQKVIDDTWGYPKLCENCGAKMEGSE